MKHLAPAYYGAFTCLADRCRDNCCIGWEIGIDPDTAAFYDSFPGETGDWRAAASLRRALTAVFCPMPRDAAGSWTKKTSVLPISGWGNSHGGDLPGTPPLP